MVSKKTMTADDRREIYQAQTGRKSLTARQTRRIRKKENKAQAGR